jgi:hypothetical protein
MPIVSLAFFLADSVPSFSYKARLPTESQTSKYLRNKSQVQCARKLAARPETQVRSSAVLEPIGGKWASIPISKGHWPSCVALLMLMIGVPFLAWNNRTEVSCC